MTGRDKKHSDSAPSGQRSVADWADEGIATLADNVDKQSRHQQDLLEALGRGTTMRLAMLMATEDYPCGHRFRRFMDKAFHW